MISPQHADHIQPQAGRIPSHQRRALGHQLRLHFGQLLQHLDAHVNQPVDVQRHLHQIEQERHVLVHRQIVAVAHRKAVEHLLHGNRALPRHHVLIEERQRLALVRRRLEAKLVARVLLHLAALGHIDAELFRKQLANLLGHFLHRMLLLVPLLADAKQQNVPLIAVVLRQRIVLAQRKMLGVQEMP